jgi:hypothetical protein
MTRKIMTANQQVKTVAASIGTALEGELGEVAVQFPDDVEVAARTAEQLRVALSITDDVTAEPWPPMRMTR